VVRKKKSRLPGKKSGGKRDPKEAAKREAAALT
jgi:hypothetical protein